MELYKNYNEKTIKLIKELGFYGKTPKEIELLIVLELEKCKKNHCRSSRTFIGAYKNYKVTTGAC